MNYCGTHHYCVKQWLMAEGSRRKRQRRGRRERSKTVGTVPSVSTWASTDTIISLKREETPCLRHAGGCQAVPQRDGANRKWSFAQTVAFCWSPGGQRKILKKACDEWTKQLWRLLTCWCWRLATVVHWLVRHQHFVVEFFFFPHQRHEQRTWLQSPSKAAHKTRKDKSVNDLPLRAGEQWQHSGETPGNSV